MNLTDQVTALRKDWAENPRWKHVERPYSAEEVVKIKGFFTTRVHISKKRS